MGAPVIAETSLGVAASITGQGTVVNLPDGVVFQYGADSTAPLSDAGKGIIRYNESLDRFESSTNGAAYVALGGGGGSFWSRDNTDAVLYPTTLYDGILAGGNAPAGGFLGGHAALEVQGSNAAGVAPTFIMSSPDLDGIGVFGGAIPATVGFALTYDSANPDVGGAFFISQTSQTNDISPYSFIGLQGNASGVSPIFNFKGLINDGFGSQTDIPDSYILVDFQANGSTPTFVFGDGSFGMFGAGYNPNSILSLGGVSNRGFGWPRVNNLADIVTPFEGLAVEQLSDNSPYMYLDGSWVKLTGGTADLVSATLATASGAIASTITDSAGVRFNIPISDAGFHAWQFQFGTSGGIATYVTGDGIGGWTDPHFQVYGGTSGSNTAVLDVATSLLTSYTSASFAQKVQVGGISASIGTTPNNDLEMWCIGTDPSVFSINDQYFASNLTGTLRNPQTVFSIQTGDNYGVGGAIITASVSNSQPLPALVFAAYDSQTTGKNNLMEFIVGKNDGAGGVTQLESNFIAWEFQNAGTPLIDIYGSGLVSIGIVAPSFSVSQRVNVEHTYLATVQANAQTEMVYEGATLNLDDDFSNGFVGHDTQVTVTGAGSLNTVSALGATVNNNQSGTTSEGFGFIGLYQQTSNGLTTDSAAVGGEINATGASIITTGSALRAFSPYTNSGDGTITTAIGLQIDAQAGAGVTNAYGINQLGALDLNLFAGVVHTTNKLIADGGVFSGDYTDPTRVSDPSFNQFENHITALFNIGDTYLANTEIYNDVNFSADQAVSVQSLSATTETNAASTHNINQVLGVLNVIGHGGSGTVNQGSAHISSVHNSGTGIITDARGINVVVANTGAGSIGDAYGILIESPSNDAGNNNVTNTYGIYIQDQNRGTNKWALYQAGPEDLITWNGISTYVDSTYTNPFTAKKIAHSYGEIFEEIPGNGEMHIIGYGDYVGLRLEGFQSTPGGASPLILNVAVNNAGNPDAVANGSNAISFQNNGANLMTLVGGGNASIVGKLGINGLDPATSPIRASGLPTYADNAAAIAGGLVIGEFYSTGASTDTVCVVH